MSKPFEQMIAYLKLSRGYRQRSMMPDRDRALLLAGIFANLAQLEPIAALCRQLILQNNPGHALRRHESFAEAITDADFQYFVNQVARRIPQEKVSLLLADLNYDCDLNRNDFANDSEFAAAIMGVDASWIKENFG